MSRLIGFRALQGMDAAGLTPVSLAIITAVFLREKRDAAIVVRQGVLAGMVLYLTNALGYSQLNAAYALLDMSLAASIVSKMFRYER